MKTDITVILDRSGSMWSVAKDTIGSFNKFLEDQKEGPGKATFTLVQFDDRYEVVTDAEPIKGVEPLTSKTFVPRGNTALLDAIGRAVDETGSRLAGMTKNSRPEKVICVIITDGQENASRKFTKSQIFDKISHQREKYKWEFVFLGANQDAIVEGGAIGIPTLSTLTYNINSPVATSNTYNSLTKSINAYRGGMSTGVAFDDKARLDSMVTDE